MTLFASSFLRRFSLDGEPGPHAGHLNSLESSVRCSLFRYSVLAPSHFSHSSANATAFTLAITGLVKVKEGAGNVTFYWSRAIAWFLFLHFSEMVAGPNGAKFSKTITGRHRVKHKTGFIVAEML